MHHDFIDRYSRMRSPIHRLSAGTKVISAFVLIILVVLTPGTWEFFYGSVAVILLAVILVSRIPVGFLLKRILFFEPFVIVIAALVLFQPDGVARFFLLVAKCTLSLLTILLLTNTTPFNCMLDFLRRLHLPQVMITTLALMYRYLFVLIDEMERLRRARKSRTFTKKQERGWVVLSTILGQLFVRSTDRAERIYAAMTARGWKGS